MHIAGTCPKQVNVNKCTRLASKYDPHDVPADDTGARPLVVMACSSRNVQRVLAGVAVAQPIHGLAVVNQARSPTLPLASFPGRKNSLVKIMVSFWLLTFEQGETNLANVAKKGGA